MNDTGYRKKTALCDRDRNLWLEDANSKLKVGDFQNLDVENLIEELEDLVVRDRRELKRGLTTLNSLSILSSVAMSRVCECLCAYNAKRCMHTNYLYF